MKYQILTKEQLEELHQEFATFLASQQIDAKEWEEIKKNEPQVVKEEIEIFSDLVWEDVLRKTAYIKHVSSSYLNLFKCNSQEMIRICVQFTSDRSFLNDEDFNWLLKNPLAVEVDYFTATKKYQKERNEEIFELIQSGGSICDGHLFTEFSLFLKKTYK